MCVHECVCTLLPAAKLNETPEVLLLKPEASCSALHLNLCADLQQISVEAVTAAQRLNHRTRRRSRRTIIIMSRYDEDKDNGENADDGFEEDDGIIRNSFLEQLFV